MNEALNRAPVEMGFRQQTSDQTKMVDCSRRAQGAGDYPLPGRSPAAADPVHAAYHLIEADKAHRSLAADQVLMLRSLMPSARAQWQQLSEGLFRWFQHQGFWPRDWSPQKAYAVTVNPRGFDGDFVPVPYAEYVRLKKAEKIALIHSEVSEMLEAVRKDDWQNEQEEFADIQIRMQDYAGGFQLCQGEPFEHKMFKNYARPAKHGKEF